MGIRMKRFAVSYCDLKDSLDNQLKTAVVEVAPWDGWQEALRKALKGMGISVTDPLMVSLSEDYETAQEEAFDDNWLFSVLEIKEIGEAGRVAPLMRAKMRVSSVAACRPGDPAVDQVQAIDHENVSFSAVCKSEGYPADGSDENNSFAKWTPFAEMMMTINNPALFGKLQRGDELYLDFTKLEKK